MAPTQSASTPVKILIVFLITSVLGMGVWFLLNLSRRETPQKPTEYVDVIATTDLHGTVGYETQQYIAKARKENSQSVLVDAGDFDDSDYGGPMYAYHKKWDEGARGMILPIAQQMKAAGYDAVVLGNHDLAAGKEYLDATKKSFEKEEVALLSANMLTASHKLYTQPYIVKEFGTKEGTLTVGIIGLTLESTGEKREPNAQGKLVPSKTRDLIHQPGYNGSLAMEDITDTAQTRADELRNKKGADIVIAVVHSGIEGKDAHDPDAQVKEIAQNTTGIDAFVAGHTHYTIEEKTFKNAEGDQVVVTQPGKRNQAISRIRFGLSHTDGAWKVEETTSKLTRLPQDNQDKNEDAFYHTAYGVNKSQVALKEIAPFEWDSAFTYKAHTPVNLVYKEAGYPWRQLVENDGTTTDIVFLKDGKVVYTLINPSLDSNLFFKFDQTRYKGNFLTLTPETVLTVKKTNDSIKFQQ